MLPPDEANKILHRMSSVLDEWDGAYIIMVQLDETTWYHVTSGSPLQRISMANVLLSNVLARAQHE